MFFFSTVSFALLFGFWIKKQYFIDKNLIKCLVIYLSLVIFTLIININQINYHVAFRDIIIITSFLGFFTIKLDYTDNHVKYLFFIMILAYGIYLNFNISLNTIKSLFVADQENHNEYIAGFIFGVFLWYFLLNRQWFFVFICIIVIMLTSKRVTFLGLICSTVAYYFIYLNINKSNESIKRLILMAVYFALMYIIAINLIPIAKFVIYIFNLEGRVTVWELLSARDWFIVTLEPEIFDTGFINYFFGHGPGQADFFLQHNLPYEKFGIIEKPANPHNDFLKINYDYGFLGIFLFFIFFYFLYGNGFSVPIFLYVIPILIIDNSLVVLYFSFIAGITARALNLEYDKSRHRR